MKLPLLILLALSLSACSTINVPIGENAKYGTLTVGYIPPTNLPEWVQSPVFRDK